MDWAREFYSLFLILEILHFVHGTCVKTKFQRVAGNGGSNDIACVSVAAQSRNVLAAEIDSSDICTDISWELGSTPSYSNPGSTYYEKKHVVEDLKPPLGLVQNMKLPIRFGVGASIEVNITFPTDNFNYGAIVLTDTLDENFNANEPPIETVMVILEMGPSGNILLSKRDYWKTHAELAPISTGSTHTFTIKALTNEIKVLIDGVLVDVEVPITHIVTLDNARLLRIWFNASGELNINTAGGTSYYKYSDLCRQNTRWFLASYYDNINISTSAIIFRGDYYYPIIIVTTIEVLLHLFN